MRRALALLAAVAVTGCGGGTVTAGVTHAPAPPAATAPGLRGLELRTALAECAAQIEVGTASGHDYSADQAHSADLPRPCRQLDPGDLIRAVRRALAGMRGGG